MMIGSRAGNTGDEMEAWLCAFESATRVPSIVALTSLMENVYVVRGITARTGGSR